jgi:hypothetical protein
MSISTRLPETSAERQVFSVSPTQAPASLPARCKRRNQLSANALNAQLDPSESAYKCPAASTMPAIGQYETVPLWCTDGISIYKPFQSVP